MHHNKIDAVRYFYYIYSIYKFLLRFISGTTTPVRKISAHEFEKGGLVKPIVTTIDGTPTFLTPSQATEVSSGIKVCQTLEAYCNSKIIHSKYVCTQIKVLSTF